jgi:hypothetical protein
MRESGEHRMNLSYAHKLLVAANQQRHGFLQIRGRQADREVQLMAEAGLVDATLNDGKDESFTAINRLTDLGHKFLRAFKDSPIPTGPRRARVKGMAGEWHLNP